MHCSVGDGVGSKEEVGTVSLIEGGPTVVDLSAPLTGRQLMRREVEYES